MTWKNVPIPETIVFPLILGFVLEYIFPKQLFPSQAIWLVLALLLFVFGVILIIWSVKEAGIRDLASPDTLITTGPYSISRNPMYVSWISIYLSIFFVNRSIWLILQFIIAFVLTHYFVVFREERFLREKFGDIFEAYCNKVRRYL